MLVPCLKKLKHLDITGLWLDVTNVKEVDLLNSTWRREDVFFFPRPDELQNAQSIIPTAVQPEFSRRVFWFNWWLLDECILGTSLKRVGCHGWWTQTGFCLKWTTDHCRQLTRSLGEVNVTNWTGYEMVSLWHKCIYRTNREKMFYFYICILNARPQGWEIRWHLQ